jgi:hypothetical protein
MTSPEWKGLLGGTIITLGLVLSLTIGLQAELPFLAVCLSVAFVLWIFRKRIG